MGEFFSEWVSWSNLFYMVGLVVAGYATTVTVKNRDKIMKEALDVAKAVIQSKWKLW